MKRPPRVVIDTNLVLSALVFAGGRLTPLRLAWQEQEELLADYLPYCKTVRIPAPPPRTPPCRDAFDVIFLELALAGKADALVTGDKDLLSLAGQFARPILSAAQFFRSFDIDG